MTHPLNLDPRTIRVVSPAPGRIFIDLANSRGESIDIRPGSWSVTWPPRGVFPRSLVAAELPSPVRHDGHPLEALRASLNLATRADWLRCLAWLVNALRPSGPYPVLILRGPVSSGKSLAARILRSLVDPRPVPLLSPPSIAPALLAFARHAWVLAFDHVSSLTPSVLEALGPLTSRLGCSGRHPSPPVRRPVILTVTDRWTCPRSLASRALVVDCPPLPPHGYRTEAHLVSSVPFDAALGALCTALSLALRQPDRPGTLLSQALDWASAASPALGCTPHELRDAFLGPLPSAHFLVKPLYSFLQVHGRWSGTASELLRDLRPPAACPNAHRLSRLIRTQYLALADNGIEVLFHRLPGGSSFLELALQTGALPDADALRTRAGGPEFFPNPACPFCSLLESPLTSPRGTAPIFSPETAAGPHLAPSPNYAPLPAARLESFPEAPAGPAPHVDLIPAPAAVRGLSSEPSPAPAASPAAVPEPGDASFAQAPPIASQISELHLQVSESEEVVVP